MLVESNLPSTLIQEKIEGTGRKAVLKGCGSSKGNENAISLLLFLNFNALNFEVKIARISGK